MAEKYEKDSEFSFENMIIPKEPTKIKNWVNMDDMFSFVVERGIVST